MSLNHLSPHLPETLWWAHHYHNMETSPSAITSSSQPNSAAFWGNSSALKLDLNNDDEEDGIVIEDERENGSISMTKQGGGKEMQVVVAKELLFEKPLTPSDVGKLNRLVIPKQHAEKYFPLNGNDSGVEKGLLLSFEDESGKAWRFRYSYWNSSQSYVLTKGWSRFVKEKRLDAGDSVLFERHRLDGDRLFIGWRRRRVVAAAPGPEGQETGVVQGQGQAVVGGWTQVYFPGGRHPYPPPHDNHRHHWPPAPLPCQPDSVNAGAAVASELQNQTRSASANYKRLRLFGVNLECQQQPDDQYSESSSEPPTPPEGSSTWTQGQAQALYQFQYFPTVHHAYFNPHTLHQDINFSTEMNQSRYNQG